MPGITWCKPYQRNILENAWPSFNKIYRLGYVGHGKIQLHKSEVTSFTWYIYSEFEGGDKNFLERMKLPGLGILGTLIQRREAFDTVSS